MANDRKGAFALNVTLPSDEAAEFLRKLAYDPKFYARFKDNPKNVLRRIPGVELQLPRGSILPRGVKPPSRKQIQAFVETGFPAPRPNPPPYNGGCRIWSILYGIASQTDSQEASRSS
jgi:hypothetical protein